MLPEEQHMKAVKIDATERTISMIETDGTLTALQEAVGGYIEAGIYYPDGDVLYVDEEGLYKGHKNFIFVKTSDHGPRIFAGDAIIVGGDEEGNQTDVKVTLCDLENIEFIDEYEASGIAQVLGI
jgi:hypothetical protein